MNLTVFTKQEQKAYDLLARKSGMVVTRDEIAQAIWGARWLQKYSDWRIDRLIYLLRRKIPGKHTIKTVRNSGYILVTGSLRVESDQKLENPGTLPTKIYLEYMNNPKNKRRVLKDLFRSLTTRAKPGKILVVNSYSFDNVDAVAKAFPESEVFFTNFDPRAITINRERIGKLKLTRLHSLYDDIRESLFKDNFFDLVINDFRLNFNTTNAQNISAMANMWRILKKGGGCIISVVVDARFESAKYGPDQEKAPINKDKPWKFIAQESLERSCFTVPYYKRLFREAGFIQIKEFDVKNGKIWDPPFRRFELTK